ncbi:MULTISPECIES: PRC-barrel domain-containing protein [Methylocystis]|jgi:sporulation protein YlmC with PRC-barrel domain|uniref:PRC-barrel domain containing protein n=1 Tax=Methylocystis rosea TaxID=173366 RepID=A0ABX6EGI2_9HYPH|nr:MULTISPECIES: PRC-barrel domain-containing protein [Methylocystis]KAF0125844.1 MAG: PRC-barrel domain-containing protein [Methylocystaceae bacterium]PWB89563.1 PRC-barrel domain containing protein [Methylocystis sp. MitZ-2018]QGM92551.1 PRC-barrel domain containing protein [Methylocystis rosea]ULO24110.1 PRC-barrel domain-containing protein [Methylocystis sp. SB2]
MLKSYLLAGALIATLSGAALAEQMNRTTDRPAGAMDRSTTGTMDRSTTGAAGRPDFLTTLPQNALLVSNIHDQNVYDPQENKIGEVKDLVLDRGGKVTAAIISVGGFLGMGEKDIAVAFSDLRATERNNKWWLTINATKDELKNATGFRFDKNKGLWTLGSK